LQERSDQPPEQHTPGTQEPVDTDPQATPAELLHRCARDYADANNVTDAIEARGGTGVREGVLPGGDQ
jgi:hypothetical protein